MKDKERQHKGRKTVFPMTRVKLADAGDNGKRKIEGYAAVFGNRDAYGDVIMPGAFERTLRERPDIKVLWQHDSDQPIGKQVQGFEDEFGLRVQGEFSNIPLVTDTAVPLLEDGVVNGLSIGYDVVEEEFNSELNTWFLRDIDLWEWSPVTFPANDLAQVTSVKELGGRKDAHVERLNRHAKAVIHELTGYFAKEGRRDVLDQGLLDELRKTLGDEAPVPEPAMAADASEGEQEVALLLGAHAALDAMQEMTTEGV